MFKIALIVFRECVEIALLLGIIMSVTRQVASSRTYITIGALFGIVAASVLAFLAFFSRTILVSFGGVGDELFNSGVLLLTTILIGWTIIWIQGYEAKLRDDINNLSIRINTGSASPIMLVLLVMVTVLREGAEIVILVYSFVAAETVSINNCVSGFIIGVIGGLKFGAAIYLGLIKFASQYYVLRISSILLMLVAAGFAAKAAGILTSSSIITILSNQFWDSSWLVSDRSMCGQLLHMVTGYIAKPNGLQVVFYVGTIGLINILSQIKIKYTSCNTK